MAWPTRSEFAEKVAEHYAPSEVMRRTVPSDAMKAGIRRGVTRGSGRSEAGDAIVGGHMVEGIGDGGEAARILNSGDTIRICSGWRR